MRCLYYFLSLFSLLNFWTSSGQAANYYFSASEGNDQHTAKQAQNPATPWQSIEKLNAIASLIEAGDSVFFKRGDVFYGGILLDRSGTEEAPIVLTAYGEGELPVISGFSTVQSWTDQGDGIYESEALPAGREVNMVVIDQVNYPMGRYPNVGDENHGYLYFESQNYNAVIDKEMSSRPNWKGAQIVLRTTRWTLERRYLYSHYGKMLRYNSSTYYKPDDDSGYFLQNHIETLDQYGEWYYNPSTHKLSVFFGDEAPEETIRVQVATIDKLVELQGDHIYLKELSLQGANVAGVYSDEYGRDKLTIEACKIQFSGVDGIYMTGRNRFSLISSKVLDSNSSGVKLHRENNDATLLDNLIVNSGVHPGMGGDGDGHYTGIFSAAGGLTAACNTIVNTGYTALRFARSDNLIQHNFINNFCTVLDDGGGIYTYTGEKNEEYHDRQIIGNIIINGRGAPEGTDNLRHFAAHGIYLDDNATDLVVEDNTVANCKGGGIYLHNVRDFEVRNNTLYNNDEQLITRNDGYGGDLKDGTIKDNILFSKNMSQHTLYLESDAADFSNIGTLSDNYHVRPFNDSLSVTVEYHNSRGHDVIVPLSLEALKENYGLEEGSHTSPLRLEPYLSLPENSANPISIGAFDSNIEGVNLWSPSEDLQKNWLASNLLGSGVLQVKTGFSPAYLGLNVGEVDQEKYYLLRFKAAASKETTLQIYFRWSGSPWSVISTPLAVTLTPHKKDYQLLFSAIHTSASAKVEFNLPNSYTQYWLDEVSFQEAEVEVLNADEHFLFEYNPSKGHRTIPLSGEYVDGRNNTVSGEITLGPYESVVLIKKDSAASPEDPASELKDLPFSTEGAQLNNQENILKLYPNPISHDYQGINLDYYAKLGGDVKMVILDQSGKQIQQLKFNMRKGWNAAYLDISMLTPGAYYLFIPNTLSIQKSSYPFVVVE